MSNATCAIWGTIATQEHGVTGDYLEFQSWRSGGRYRVSGSAAPALGGLSREQKAKLTTWLVDQRRAGVRAPMINTEVLDRAKERRQLRFSEKKQRFFLCLAAQRFSPSQYIKVSGVQDKDYTFWTQILSAWMESVESGETGAMVRLLGDEKLVAGSELVSLTAKGFQELERAEIGNRDSRQGFVAMWFNPSLDVAYTDGFAPAITDAGYRSFRIDKKEHANKIDDEIVAEIRRSRFVVADFTSELIELAGRPTPIARGGVYYEAGFAQGLGIPVLWSCRHDLIDHVHFDTRQFAHIVWETPEDLRSKLYNRIAAVLGHSSSRD